MLMQMGIKPHMLVCRSENPVDHGVLRKLAQRLRLPEGNVIDLHTQESVYQVPPHLALQHVDELTLQYFELPSRPRRTRFNFGSYLQRLSAASDRVVVGLAGKYLGPRDTYASILSALEHAGCACGVTVEVVDVSSDAVEHAGGRAGRLQAAAAQLAGLDGLIVPGGFGRRGWEGKISCITHARSSGLPLLGICYGFQAAMVEYARECCDMADANTTENDAATTDPVVCLLPEQYEIEGIGGSMRLGRHAVALREGSRVAELYGATRADERFRHRYEFNPLYRKVIEDNGMVFSGWAPGQPIVQVAELPQHPFFIGVQFHPEFTSRPAKPNPLFRGFVQACMAHRRAENRATEVEPTPPMASSSDSEVASGVAVARDSAMPAIAGGNEDAATGSGNGTRSGASAIAAQAESRRRNPT